MTARGCLANNFSSYVVNPSQWGQGLMPERIAAGHPRGIGLTDRRSKRRRSPPRQVEGFLSGCLSAGYFGKAGHRLRLVIMHVEYGIKLGNLQEVVNLLGEVQEFQLAALV